MGLMRCVTFIIRFKHDLDGNFRTNLGEIVLFGSNWLHKRRVSCPLKRAQISKIIEMSRNGSHAMRNPHL